MLTKRALNRALLARQLLLERASIDAKTAVAQLAALQAQVPKPPYLALWSRLAAFTRDDLHAAIANRQLVRGTMMRATLHLATVDDFMAWRAALQPVLARTAQSIAKTEYDVDALCATAREFFDEQPRTFDELRDEFPKGDERLMAYAVRMHLPLLMVPDDSTWSYPPNAAFAVAETFTRRKIGTNAAPHELVLRYLDAFGPATPADFQNWSGLKGARSVFDELRPQLETFRDGKKRELFDVPNAPRPDEETAAPIRLLPEFDSAILGHDDRSRIIADEHRPRVVTKNLRILATILVDGFVAGTWAVKRKSKSATLTITPFVKLDKRTRAALVDEGEKMVAFSEPGVSAIDVKFD
ncbi:MAG TPA: winged helix DNA-binding domain-containing protein [Thermoanaerobaculia bacterium]|nr:winged helix DNA-binding domain-containing protein [Thermoanaerobaculia bacterium]